MYTDELLRRFLSTSRHGGLERPDGLGVQGNVTCGDVVQLAVRLDSGRVAEARFATLGCAIAIAASDLVCELVEGSTLTAAQTLRVADLERVLGEIPPDRTGCASIVLGALRLALEQARAGLIAGTA